MENLEQSFWSVSIYVDKDENLLGIPCGLSDKYGVADIDVVMRLKAPYSDRKLENYIESVIEKCYSKKHNDESDVSTIEKYTKIKSFVNATKDFTLITVVKTKEEGYSIMPTFNDFERGPIVIDDDEVCLPEKYAVGQMAAAIRRMIAIYVKANAAAAAGAMFGDLKN